MAEMKKKIKDIVVSINKLPKVPWDEGVCKICGVDKDDDCVLLCDTYDAEYHTYCLNPPLIRILDGNWYCPSCVIAKHMAQDVLESFKLVRRWKGRKYQGQLTRASMETMAHLADAMEEKDYCEFSAEELLAEATKKMFGSLTRENDVLSVKDDDSDGLDATETNACNGDIPEWALALEHVRKLPTNVGTRIRKCVYDALESNPPEWAKKILEHSISKEVYKGNASGPTKKAVLSLLADVRGGDLVQRSVKGTRKRTSIGVFDVIMKKCHAVLRDVAAADEDKVFRTLLGRKLLNSSDNDDDGLLGSLAMVARPLDFITIDLRLAAGAYDGSTKPFLEDVLELWSCIRAIFADQSDCLELVETLSGKFKSLYEAEVLPLVQKPMDYRKLECLSTEMRSHVQNVSKLEFELMEDIVGINST